MRDEIDDILRSRLHNVEIHEGLPNWERIEESVGKIEEGGRKKSFFLFRSIWGYAASGLILLSFSLGVYWLYSGQSKQMVSTLDKGNSIVVDTGNFSHKEKDKELKPVDQHKTDDANYLKTAEDPKNIAYLSNDILFNSSNIEIGRTELFVSVESENQTDSTFNDNDFLMEYPPIISSFLNLQTQLIIEEKFKYDIDTYLADFNSIYNDIGIDQSVIWGSGLFYDFMAIHFIPSNEGTSTKLTDINDYKGKPNVSNNLVLLLNNDLINKYRETIYNIMVDYPYDLLSHKFPISFSIVANRKFGSIIGVESGIVYTYMESYSGVMTRNSIYYNQKLHYLGIPLTLNYSILPNSSVWNIDLKGGFLAEKSISSVGATTVYDNFRVLESYVNKSNPKEIMLSTNLGFGFGYKLFKDFGIYMEPSMAYYFYTKGQPLSYKTDRPLSFNLKAGIRFDF